MIILGTVLALLSLGASFAVLGCFVLLALEREKISILVGVLFLCFLAQAIYDFVSAYHYYM